MFCVVSNKYVADGRPCDVAFVNDASGQIHTSSNAKAYKSVTTPYMRGTAQPSDDSP